MPPSNSAPGATSIRDVARRAGVSHMTVSRVLNGAENVRPATRDQVLAAIAELNFRPSHIARALASGGIRTIGILDTTGGLLYGPSNTIWAIELAARRVGYSAVVAGVEPSDRDSVRQAVEHLLDQDASGLIVIGPSARAREVVDELAPRVPIVTMHGTGDESVIIAQAAAARVATRHLLDLGHTRIAHIAGPTHWYEATSRRQGFTDELAAAGLEPAAVEPSDWSPASGYQAATRLLERSEFSAVFCANDSIALGFIHAATDAGLDVPADVSVVGFDDTPESAHYRPPLTTLRQDFAEGGRRAVLSILAALGNDVSVPESSLVPQLVVRASTAARA
ncbi:LacI family transcriptional regulator [Microbacterium protaetiae]|uniref:LacI family transcriptional regulator n=1 Tax=Microbacterium protaetiae TaxID=2509458 RepID=A0A4P6EB13_9MICO|nr:LacI family DNA-binding transcriptional regulator [Microbacterium protaetiae]QAY59184.1 LacI family transcriptional regulator [Microbacterium protaetiae]